MIHRVWISECERMFKRKKTKVVIMIYLLLVGLQALFLYIVGGISFYNAEEAVSLNSLNTAPFFLRELAFFLTFVIIPMFVVDSFNGEHTSGAYRLVLLRPHERVMLLAVKLSVQGAVIFSLLLITWLLATFYGQLVFPQVEEVAFFQTGSLRPFQAVVYGIVFYLIAFLILFAVISIGSVISSLMPNSILAYGGIVGFIIALLYVSEQFYFFVTMSDSIFLIMAELQVSTLMVILSLILGSGIINIVLWKKRDWVG
ncbi:ABC transporter permease subunit [Alkalihalobacillus oceani]|uniref:ABC transporter permease subunit n=1 Tax=Halalkalibacter oceani TaxID=1653776 RepID=UPI00204029F3|nr:ABC transporter permease subunit [Halalkalibacter oceani]MCM3761417.1 ABC transporter permease subunit [Halalkalibacter oceani]